MERPTTNLQAPPLKEALVQPAAAPNLPPADSAAQPAATMPAPQVVRLPTPIKPQLTSLETPSSSSLNSIVLGPLPPLPNSIVPMEPELTSLITHGRQPFAPLIPTEVLPAASPPPLKERFQLTALQPLPAPGVNLQPTEVLPIPSPIIRPLLASPPRSTPSGRSARSVQHHQHFGPHADGSRRRIVSAANTRRICLATGKTQCTSGTPRRCASVRCATKRSISSATVTRIARRFNLFYRACTSSARPWRCRIASPLVPFGTCQYPLGHYRPGSPVPFRHIRPELRPWPAAVECMTIAGLILLIP